MHKLTITVTVCGNGPEFNISAPQRNEFGALRAQKNISNKANSEHVRPPKHPRGLQVAKDRGKVQNEPQRIIPLSEALFVSLTRSSAAHLLGLCVPFLGHPKDAVGLT